jgi:hypothetical protein
MLDFGGKEGVDAFDHPGGKVARHGQGLRAREGHQVLGRSRDRGQADRDPERGAEERKRGFHAFERGASSGTAPPLSSESRARRTSIRNEAHTASLSPLTVIRRLPRA